MTIRRALFLGGAVLVLAACADSTAPTATARQGGSAAALKKPTPSTTPTPTMTTMSTGCRGGYVVASGNQDTTATSDSTCASEY